MTESTAREKTLLIGLAALSLIILAVLGIMALRSDGMDANAAGMIGVIVTGLIAFSKDVIQAIRSYSMSAQLGKVTDQLAASGPVIADTPPAADAISAADDVAGAAKDEANRIKGA